MWSIFKTILARYGLRIGISFSFREFREINVFKRRGKPLSQEAR